MPAWWWLAGLVALLALGLGAFSWKRRAGETKRLAPPQITPYEPTGESVGSATAAAAAPPQRLDITLDIVNASRSVMMFTLDYRINIANRSDRAVRDLSIAARLASAELGATNAPRVAGGHPVGTVERIGPHQARAITGQMQLPLAEVRAILQGRKPLFIPLLHLTFESSGQSAFTRSFVLGLPSTTAQGRLHPIPLDTPPGGVPGLRAREISLAA